jgi:enoyl-CoA hydratase
MRHAPKPVIAAINGPAIGGGLCLALGTDIRLAAESAYFRAAGINNGLTALELGLSYTLPRAIGTSRAFEMALTGRDVSSDEAVQMGLISRVVPDEQLMDEAIAMAKQILGWSTNGVVHTKRLLWAGLESGSIENAFELESKTQLFMRMTTQNFEEAMRARKEGRSPTFSD